MTSLNNIISALSSIYSAERLSELSGQAEAVRLNAMVEHASHEPLPEDATVSATGRLLLEQTVAAFQAAEDRALFELGQWIEVIQLGTHLVSRPGESHALSESLRDAHLQLSRARSLSQLDPLVLTHIDRLANIDLNDGLSVNEIALASRLSTQIKSLVN